MWSEIGVTFNDALSLGKEAVAFIVLIVGVVTKWYQDNKDEINKIVLRVQKDMKDGWTQKEKERLAIDLFFQEVYPRLPFYIRWFTTKKLIRKLVSKGIKSICGKAYGLKGKIDINKKKLAI